MKMKKVLSGVLAAAMTVTAVTVTSLTISAVEEYIDVTVNTDYDYLSQIIFTDNGNTYIVNGQEITTTYWNQVDRKNDDETDNEYTAAFGDSSVEGSSQAFSFKTPKTTTEIKLIAIMYSNTESKSIAHDVAIDATKASDNKLNVQLVPQGDIATEQTNSWYYLQSAKLNYIGYEEKPNENGEISLSKSEISIEELQEYESLTITYNPQTSDECGHVEYDASHTDNTYCIWASVPVLGKLKNTGVEISDSKKTDWYQPGDSSVCKVASNKDENPTSAVVKVSKIIDSFTSDEDWEDDFELKSIFFQGWNCTLVSVTGKPIESEEIAVTKVTLDEETLSLSVGETAELTATVDPENATDKTVTWKSGNEDVATVEDGVVTAVGKGTATITATAGEKSATCEVTVTVPVDEVTLDQDTLFLLTDETATLTATVKPADASDKTVTWKTSNANVATVKDGVVTAVGKGTATITATAGKKSATCAVTVADPAKKITLDDITVLTGEEKPITYTVDPDGADLSNITYTSSDEDVFTVANGKVKGVGAGTATLTMTAANAGNAKLEATCKVTVSDEAVPATKIELNKSELELVEGGNETLTATVTPANTTDTLIWSSSDSEVATVDQNGKVTAVKEGEATITVKANADVSASCKVTVTAKTPEGIVDPDDGLVIEVEDEDITIEAEPGTFEETVTVVKAEVSVSEEVAEEKTEAISDAIKDILDGEESTVEVGAVISITLKDQDGNEIQPVDGGTVTITVPYDGKSNYAAYIDGEAPEFIKLAIDEAGEYASFEAKHFSDYYLVALSDEAADAIDKENGGDGEKNNVSISFKDEKFVLKVIDASGWGDGFTKAAQVNTVVTPDGVTYEETKYGDIKNMVLTLNGIIFKNCEIDSVEASDVSVSLYFMHRTENGNDDEWIWTAGTSVKMTESSLTWDLSTVSGVADSNVIRQIGYQININGGDVAAIEEMEIDATFELNGEEDKDDNKPAGNTIILSEEETVMDSKWGVYLEIPSSKFADINSAGKIVVTIKDVAEKAQYGFRYGDSWTNYILPNGYDYSDEMTSSQTSYEVEINDAFLAILKENKLIITGHDYTIVKVEYVTNGGGNTPSTPSQPSTSDTTAPTPTPTPAPGGNFVAPPTSGGSSGDGATTAAPDNTTAAPEDTTAAPSAPAATDATEENTATNTTPPAYEDNGDGNNAPSDGGNGNVGNDGAGNAGDKNAPTGVTLALIPIIAAAAGVVISKKRK